MKVKVYSDSEHVKINAVYEGDDVLPMAREFARDWSRFAPVILETNSLKEVYENKNLKSFHEKTSFRIKVKSNIKA